MLSQVVELIENKSKFAITTHIKPDGDGVGSSLGLCWLLRSLGKTAEVIVHDPKNRSVAHMLVEMPMVGFPVALGVLYDDPASTFESAVVKQNEAASKGKTPDLQMLVSQGQTWQVDKEPRAE